MFPVPNFTLAVIGTAAVFIPYKSNAITVNPSVESSGLRVSLAWVEADATTPVLLSTAITEFAISLAVATARDIANSVMAVESKTGVVASASTHARLTLNPDDSTDGFTVIAFDLYGMNTAAVPITASVKFGTGNNSAYPDLDMLNCFQYQILH